MDRIGVIFWYELVILICPARSRARFGEEGELLARRERGLRSDARAPARFRKLKPRPGQSGKEVADHQRGRIHAATIELVNEGGYGALTVTGIARAAGVSNHTFYENFHDKEDCFLATYELIVRHAAREVLAARRRECDWRARLRAGFLAFVHEVAENPKAARLALVEAYAAGPTALERIDHTRGLFEALVDQSLAEAEDGVEMPRLIVRGIVAGVARVARARLLAGRGWALQRDVGELEEWALSLRDNAATEVCRSRGASAVDGRVGMPGNGHDVTAGGTGWLPGADERGLILTAAARMVADEGYEALTVPRIRTAAGVSRSSFDAHFESVEDCFLTALEWGAGHLLSDARTAFLEAGGWPGGVYRAFAMLCAQIANKPFLGRLGFVDVFAPGGQGVRWRARFVANMGGFLRGSAPPGQRPTELGAEASAGAVCEVVRHHVATGQARRLPQAAGALSYIVLAPAIGAAAAEEAIRIEQELEGSSPMPGGFASPG